MKIDKKFKNIDLIVTDIDGTLLNDFGEVGDRTIENVKKLREYGVKFSFASGRLHGTLKPYADTLNLHSPLISLDGALIKDHPNGKKHHNAFLSSKDVSKAIDYSDKMLLNVALCHDESIYYTENNSVIPQMMEKFGARYKEVNSYENYLHQVLEVVIVSDSKRAIKYICDRFSFPYSIGVSKNYYRSHSHEGIYYLELRKKGCSKGDGLKRLAKMLRVKLKNTAVIGDWYNDLSLFDVGAFNVAVQNAVPELKRKADLVTESSNNEDGVGEFLEMIIKAKES